MSKNIEVKILNKIVFYFLLITLLNSTSYTKEVDAFDLYDWMETLKGEWKLSPANKQIGTNSYKHKALRVLVGTNTTAISFKTIGRNSTVQEDLLPNTAKQMVTMYHCKDLECNKIKATHYCVKQNQPEFIANLLQSTKNKIIFDCDMSTELCKSTEDHVHQIIHEISKDRKHLKTSYLSWENKKPKKNSSIYYFDKK